ncbi:MAG: hypothetical protein K6T83_16935, partial [Alicyclobacillus sp.]|nr:hypothetical protein [Alicyclobacillus sp.]
DEQAGASEPSGGLEIEASMYFTAFPPTVAWCMLKVFHLIGAPFRLEIGVRQTDPSLTGSAFSIVQPDS